MKANELMTFDLVRRKKDNRTMIVVEVGYDENIGAITTDDRFYGDFEDYHETQVEPIPITPEILEKNGFTNYGESWYIPNTEDCVIVGFHMCETMINISKDRVSFSKSIPCEYRSCYSNRKVYIHELQHALRLCGIEKEIVL